MNTITMPSGNILIEHPSEIGNHSWQRFTVEHVRSGQSGAYKDTITEMKITLEGWSPSAKEGFDLPGFGIGIPEAKIKQLVKGLTGGEIYDKDDEREWHKSYWGAVVLIEKTTFLARWRVEIVTPYTD
jgi:hypothetical protein